ncbi:MAG TPA: hypothetical protein VJQ25_14360 [Nitrospira sp.]|nr:hypothetical protein [Nitrospira sp.]
MQFSNKSLRSILRVIHLVVAALIGAHLYSPLGDLEWYVNLVRATVLPVLMITGLSMWQMPALTKFLKGS